MKRISATYFLLFFVWNLLIAQKTPIAESRIIRLNPPSSPFGRIMMRTAQYDPAKNFLPYYLLTQETRYNEQANATLIVKNTVVLKGEAAVTVREAFSSF